ncbi:dockerin type I domain-containing protein [Stieleria sp. JC731]|uniref:peroxidase family protein n=1 Tax=Stieleria sp. JC731 TaxID=2894195 RepID=UPI001E43EA56|nr:peroxidase family protein [Stieleria sp. JC731]MCC9599407.1 dockerin type I domain-containing protein [Stieleria sp. JC731]
MEARQLLAADLGLDSDFSSLPETEISAIESTLQQGSFESEDVNRDGQVSPLDSLMVINRLGRNGPSESGDSSLDTNRDGQITPMDALRIINRMSRQQNERGPSPPPPAPPESPATPEIQSFDGTGNNLENPEWGSTGIEFTRDVASDYADGVSTPSGEDRASAREISNLVSAQDESIESERGLSSYIWQFGQFIDHDIDLTLSPDHGSGESFNIDVPTGDIYFDPQGTGDAEISLTRSLGADGSGDSVDNPLEQVNGITAFIDGSMIYGSDAERADALRSFEGGRLLTSEGDLLPYNTEGIPNGGGTGDNLFIAGDLRANEQVGLLAMHTLWVREHNRIADQISADNPDLSDEQIYQRARRMVIAELQAITFNEYLPALLGRDAITPYEGYDSTVDPSISNLFATAGFRYGHSTLPTEILRLDDNGEVIEAGNLALRDAFFNPSVIAEGGIESILNGMAAQRSQEVDTKVVDDLRNFLFGPPGSGGFDLVSLNIQRGRDHGLPDYNSVREQLGLDPAETFADITSDVELQVALEQAYGDTSDIDVWVGALAEDHAPGASVGETLQTIIADQFMAIRDGDRFWYQNTLEGEQLRQASQTRLSDVIERNTTLTSLQDHVFFVDGVGPNSQTPPPGSPTPDNPLPPDSGDVDPGKDGPDNSGPDQPHDRLPGPGEGQLDPAPEQGTEQDPNRPPPPPPQTNLDNSNPLPRGERPGMQIVSSQSDDSDLPVDRPLQSNPLSPEAVDQFFRM